MSYPIKDREDLREVEELASLQNQVNAKRLQYKFGTHNFREDMKKVFDPGSKSLENTAQDETNTRTESSKENNLATENLNNKFLEIMDDKGIIASYLLSHLSKITNPENTI